MNAAFARWLFLCSVAAAALYFGTIYVLAAFDPNYSHFRHFANDLGRATAATPSVYNASAIAQGLLFIVAGALLHLTVKALSGRRVLSGVTGLFLAAFGVSALFVGFFPLPDPRHSGYGVALLSIFVPWLLAWAFWKKPAARSARYYQLLATPVLFATLLWQTGAIGFVTEGSIGLVQRIAAATFYVWFAGTCYWLNRRTLAQVPHNNGLHRTAVSGDAGA